MSDDLRRSATRFRRNRWSDNDRYFGPFTYARERAYRRFAVVLNSGDDDESLGCSLRICGFGHTIITVLPQIIRPWRKKVPMTYARAEQIVRLGRDWYWDIDERQYGFSCQEGFLSVYFGRQTHDSSTEQRWGYFLPWTQWRFIRHSLYGLAGEHVWTQPRSSEGSRLGGYEALAAAQDACPSVTFAFDDFDGQSLTVRTMIEEREWWFGEGWFKWLSLFRPAKIRRSLDLRFSGETGRRKGSWKGGTVGHSIDMLPGELHEHAFRRYCAERGMVFKGC